MPTKNGLYMTYCFDGKFFSLEDLVWFLLLFPMDGILLICILEVHVYVHV